MRLIITPGKGSAIPLAQSFAAVNAPADTAENIIATINLPPLGANDAIRLLTMWSFTDSGNSKTIRARLSGIGGTVYLNAAGFTNQLVIQSETIIGNRNSQSSQVGATAYISTDTGTFFKGVKTTSAVNTAVATTLVLTAEKAVGAETVTLEYYLVEIIPGG